MKILVNFSNYLPYSQLLPLKPGGHMQLFWFANPPLKHPKLCGINNFCRGS
jgi:hypothetical protein